MRREKKTMLTRKWNESKLVGEDIATWKAPKELLQMEELMLTEKHVLYQWCS